MDLIKLVGVLIVIGGFTLKLDSILIILLALISTGLAGGLGIRGLLDAIGSNFVGNRNMAIFVMILLITGALEKNGLREAAADLIRKIKGATAGKVIVAYGAMRAFFGALNVSFGGVAGFVRPVVLPMAEAAASESGHEVKEEYLEEIKGMASAMENIAWFFFQVLFIGGSGGILVQTTLRSLGYEVELISLAAIEIPVAITALLVGSIIIWRKDRRLIKKYDGRGDGKNEVD